MYKLEPCQAAQRHYQDGVTLFEQKRFDNAGYHFGLAAECALKKLLLGCPGVRPGDPVIQKL